ncbi:SGNH/GDSL hydrolase family protein [Paenibacillus polymyxa]|uniref:SGNH/GDSL hydrolase family protein n=1 Tax=Paenibacillus polymyxa TaxID=1406 RepID=UPI0025B62DCE|nr:SGNH/GDSL hydrolase family protein [Paenibacillus polymyxa]MDN4082441.1 SGNH/GDSL hydrolase family protein [Paenibacillus polymyxa]MDN4109983.1 SGNH/GDSL hydrolase family protein [Paenibacillus polymyxa]
MLSTGHTRILFQGDSITDGGRGRNEDANHWLGQSYVYLIAGALGSQLATTQPEFVNRGVSGDRVSDLYARWNEDTFSLQPNLLSILIGVNDAWRIVEQEPSGVTDRFERAYCHLLEETREVMPDTGLILCEPFILKTGATEARWDTWQEKITGYQRIVRQFADKYGAVFVPLQSMLNEAATKADASYWLHDGVHPTAVGHQLIADQWIDIVQKSPLAIR